jgi:hypothetical protein
MTDETLVIRPDEHAAEPAGAPLEPQPQTAPTRPRTRWAAIVWGVVFAALALAGMSLTSNPAALTGFPKWVMEVEVGTLIGYGLLAVGALVLIVGLVGLLRLAQVSLARRARE